MLNLGPKKSVFGQDKNFSLKIQNKHFLILIVSYNFIKIWWTYFDKSSHILILGPKMPHLPHFRHNIIFSQKMGFVTFICLLIPNLKLKNQEKVVVQSWENGVTDAQTEGQTWIHRTLCQSQDFKNQIQYNMGFWYNRNIFFFLMNSIFCIIIKELIII